MMYIFLCCVIYFDLTWPDLHFTTDYILYNWVCDENLEPNIYNIYNHKI